MVREGGSDGACLGKIVTWKSQTDKLIHYRAKSMAFVESPVENS